MQPMTLRLLATRLLACCVCTPAMALTLLNHTNYPLNAVIAHAQTEAKLDALALGAAGHADATHHWSAPGVTHVTVSFWKIPLFTHRELDVPTEDRCVLTVTGFSHTDFSPHVSRGLGCSFPRDVEPSQPMTHPDRDLEHDLQPTA